MSKTRAPSTAPFVVASPLWTRAPSRDENGKPYFDFMMLIPGLKKQNQAGIESYVLRIKNCLQAFENVVVYVDLNTRLNLLWISIKPIPHVSRHIMQAIQYEIPDAKVVAGDFNPESDQQKLSRPLLVKIKQSIKTRLWIKGV